MNKLELMKLLNEVSEDHLKVDVIRQLGPYINDSKVLDVLCREAIETASHRVREALIRTLRGNPEEANRRLSRIAICAKNPKHRRWTEPMKLQDNSFNNIEKRSTLMDDEDLNSSFFPSLAQHPHPVFMG